MKFRTEISKIIYPFHIRHGEKIMLTGSCFSDNIGKKLEFFGFDVLSNPFGIVYNPFSIAEQLERLCSQHIPEEEEYKKRNELWHHFDFHSSLSGTELKIVMADNAKLISSSFKFLSETKFLFVTLGTSIVYRIKTSNKLVANNHKYPSDYFIKESLSPEEIESKLSDCFMKILEINPGLKIILNISPVRHLRDGLVENQRSKAKLLTAVEKITDNKNVFYFPSYEILMDDLRDYRFYSDDLIHPSLAAIEYIWEKFSDAFFENDTLGINQKVEKIRRSTLHRPLFPETESYSKFIEELNSEIQKFKTEYPFVKI